VRSRILGALLFAVVASVATSVWVNLGPRIDRCDVAAWASLRGIADAQGKFQRDDRIDMDRDGVGEFGYFGELSGISPLPGSGALVEEPYLSTAFRSLRPDGTVSRSGYRLRVFLPGPGGRGVGEGGTADPALAARRWCAYAWPADYGNTGNITLFIDQDGAVLGADDPRYSGDRGPEPGAAYASGGLTSITGETRPGVRAQDGNAWRPFYVR
jgi:hypothetical protein